MCQCIKYDRIASAVLLATHDAVVHVQGGSRFTSSGRKVKPLSAAYAAEVTGHTEKHIRNCIDPNQDTHQLTLRAWVLMLLAGMDTSPLEELARSLNMVLVRVPSPQEHAHLAKEVLACGEEFGDVCRAISGALDKKSPGGKSITRREREAIRREIDENVAQLYALFAAVEDEAKAV